jgi:hypothetical protein
LECKADINERDSGYTDLEFAIKSKNLSTIRFLLSHNAKIYDFEELYEFFLNYYSFDSLKIDEVEDILISIAALLRQLHLQPPQFKFLEEEVNKHFETLINFIREQIYNVINQTINATTFVPRDVSNIVTSYCFSCQFHKNNKDISKEKPETILRISPI